MLVVSIKLKLFILFSVKVLTKGCVIRNTQFTVGGPQALSYPDLMII